MATKIGTLKQVKMMERVRECLLRETKDSGNPLDMQIVLEILLCDFCIQIGREEHWELLLDGIHKHAKQICKGVTAKPINN